MIDQFKKQISSGRLSFKGVVAFLLFGAIIVVFAFWGMFNDGAGQGLGSAARVNRTFISVADFQQELSRLEQMYSAFFQQMGGGGEAQRQFLQQQALESLITSELVNQSASKMGLKVADAEILDVIVNEVPAFQDSGRFQKSRYLQVLEANRMNPAQFEERIRKDKLNAKVREVFVLASGQSEIEKQKMAQLKQEKLKVQFLKLSREQFVKENSGGPLDSSFVNEDLKKRAKEEYQANIKNYTLDEAVKTSHILIKSNTADPKSETAALSKIQEIQKEIQKGSFEKIAREKSEDKGSAVKGGDLGWVERGQMVPEFENAAFNLAPGQTSAPVKSMYGYHLIRVLEKRDPKVRSFEEVENEILARLVAEKKYDDLISQLESAAQAKDLAQLQKIASSMGQKWQTTDSFDRMTDIAPGLGSEAATKEAWKLSPEKPLSGLIRDAGSSFVVQYLEKKSEPVPNAQSQEAVGSMEAFNQWIESAKKTATIERNQNLLGR